MNKGKRLVKTQKAVQHCVNKAEHALSWTMKQCHDKQASIDSLENYQNQYQQSKISQAKKGISAHELQQIEGFIGQIDFAVTTEKQQLDQLHLLAREKQQQLTEQQCKKTAIDNLNIRYQHQQQDLNNKSEQTELDDFSIIHHHHGK